MYRSSRQLISLGARARHLSLLPKRIPALSFATKSDKPPFSAIDPKHDAEIAQRPIRSPPPDQVSSTSTTSSGFPQTHTVAGKQVGNGIKDDLNAIKDAFALVSVPREAHYIGLAGTLPYLATSMSTMYLSWSLNREWPQAGGVLNQLAMNHESAQQYLAIMEPVQLSYGAVIISFLGAIHWGMEWNERQPPNPDRTRARYAIGVAAPAIAWPTLLMPLEFALTSQFAAFAGLYFVDARMAERGWAPRWYAPYRFILTAVVGAAVGITLIGRAKIGDDARKSATRASFLDKGLAAEGEGRDWEKEEEKVKAERAAQEEAQRKEEAEKKNKSKAKSPDDSDTTHKKTKEKSKDWAAAKQGHKGEQNVEDVGGVRGQQPKAKVIKTGGSSEAGSDGPTAAEKSEKIDHKADKSFSSDQKEKDGESDSEDESEEKGGLLAGQGVGKGHAEVAKKTKGDDRPSTKAKGKPVSDE